MKIWKIFNISIILIDNKLLQREVIEIKLIEEIQQGEFDSIVEPAIREIEIKFGINLTIHDLRGRLHNKDGTPILPGRNEHQHICCKRRRYEEPDWNRRCTNDCFSQTELTANTLQKPFIKLCWKGLVELVVPVFLRDQHLLSILAGVFRHPDGIPKESDLPKWFYPEYSKLPVLDLQKMEKLSNVLRIIGHGLIASTENKLQQSAEAGRKLQIYQFIEDHAHENIKLDDLGASMGISSSRARHLVKELTNRNFKSLLEEERMLRARYLLQSTNHTLELIAETVGFKNGYYFNRAFKNYFGKPPGQFRRELCQNSSLPKK